MRALLASIVGAPTVLAGIIGGPRRAVNDAAADLAKISLIRTWRMGGTGSRLIESAVEVILVKCPSRAPYSRYTLGLQLGLFLVIVLLWKLGKHLALGDASLEV